MELEYILQFTSISPPSRPSTTFSLSLFRGHSHKTILIQEVQSITVKGSAGSTSSALGEGSLFSLFSHSKVQGRPQAYFRPTNHNRYIKKKVVCGYSNIISQRISFWISSYICTTTLLQLHYLTEF